RGAGGGRARAGACAGGGGARGEGGPAPPPRRNRQLAATQRRQRPREGEPDASGAVLAVGGEGIEETRTVRDGEVGVGDAESDELAGRAGCQHRLGGAPILDEAGQNLRGASPIAAPRGKARPRCDQELAELARQPLGRVPGRLAKGAFYVYRLRLQHERVRLGAREVVEIVDEDEKALTCHLECLHVVLLRATLGVVQRQARVAEDGVESPANLEANRFERPAVQSPGLLLDQLWRRWQGGRGRAGPLQLCA